MMKLIAFLFIAPFLYLNAQNLTAKEIDKVIENSKLLLSEGHADEYIKISEDIIKNSEKIHYLKGVTTGYYRKSLAYYFKRDFYQSLDCTEKALNANPRNISPLFKARLYQIEGQNYEALSLIEESIDSYKKMLLNSKKITDYASNYTYRSIANHDLATIHIKHNRDFDSGYYYYLKIYKLLDNNQKYNNLALAALLSKSALSLSKIKEMKGEPDSSSYYRNKSIDFLKKIEDTATIDIAQTTTYQNLAKILYDIKDYEKSKKFNNQYTDIANKTDIIEYKHNGYELKYQLSKVLNMDNDSVLSRDSKDYEIIRDSLEEIDNVNVKESLKSLVGKNKSQLKRETNRSRYFSAAVVALIFLLIFSAVYFRYYFKNWKKRKDGIINEKENKVLNLESKINSAFDDVIQLAKENSPHFLARFCEVYPDFHENLLKYSPDLHSSEITFCAYIKLNFSTKEIARYTFVAPKTIQMRKYRLRKKFNISSDVDLYVWIKNFEVPSHFV